LEIIIIAISTVLLLTIQNWLFSIPELIRFIKFKKNNPEKKEGLFKTFYENGNIKSEDNYQNWKLNGVCKSFYENGNIKSENIYRNNELNGVCKSFYENGNIESEYNFLSETSFECKKWHSNGQIKHQEKYTRFLKQRKCWNENGEQVKCK
jgi:antitoxin component YwqK of YwqJK toxin-antitoxin module